MVESELAIRLCVDEVGRKEHNNASLILGLLWSAIMIIANAKNRTNRHMRRRSEILAAVLLYLRDLSRNKCLCVCSLLCHGRTGS